MLDFPVDIVYLWCDSSDNVWREKKNKELAKYGKPLDKDSIGECRFIENDELKYSLRSLEKYAPWIRRVYIITDNQIPKWLNINNPKVHVVDHTQILSPEALPTFNSSAIETSVHKIPGLSEHFLFANDDMFFGNYVDKEFFFDENGAPVFRFGKRRILNKTYRGLYGYMLNKAYNMVLNKFGKSYARYPHHNIDAYRISDIEKCYNEFRESFEQTKLQKFREKECVQRSIFGYYSVANSISSYKITDDFLARVKAFYNKTHLDSMSAILKSSKLKYIEKQNPYLFCLNDSLKTTDKDRLDMKKFLERKFPNHSSFEKVFNKKAEISVCYHKKSDLIENEILKPVQVGAELSNIDLGIAKDNTGVNISKKNKNYCELTALYHMWKNSDADIVGLMHYRRIMDFGCGKKRWFNKFTPDIAKEMYLDKSSLESLFEGYDIILPMKRVIQQSDTVYNYYKKRHIISDLDKVLEIINDKTPEIYDTAIDVLKNNREMYLYNMFVTSKDFLNEYASWLFDILETLESEIQSDVEQRDSFQQRVYGFLSERLLTVYVEYKKQKGFKIKEVPVVYCETNRKRYNIFQLRTKVYTVLTKFGIRRPHWREQYGV